MNTKRITEIRSKIISQTASLWQMVWDSSDDELEALRQARNEFAEFDLKAMAELLADMAGGELTARADAGKSK